MDQLLDYLSRDEPYKPDKSGDTLKGRRGLQKLDPHELHAHELPAGTKVSSSLPPTAPVATSRSSEKKILAYEDGNKPIKGKLQLSEAIPKFVLSELDGDWPGIGDVLTLSGSQNSFAARSCRQHLAEYWPHNCDLVLELLQGWRSVHHDKRTSFKVEVGATSISLRCLGESIYDNDSELFIQASSRIANDILESFAWLTAALNDFHRDGMGSDVRIWHLNSVKPGDFKIRMEPKSDPVWDSLHACWRPLRWGIPIVTESYGRSTVSRTTFPGLELDFNLMVHLAGVEYFLEFKGTYLLKGPYVAIIPVHIDQSHNLVRWHAIHTKNPPLLLALVQDYFQNKDLPEISDLEFLQSARCLLGYSPLVNINLASKSCEFEIISGSGPACVHADIIDVSATKSKFPLNFGVRITKAFGSSPIRLPKAALVEISNRTLTNSSKLDIAAEEPLLLFDTATKKGWLVPELCVVLHMVHYWAAWRQGSIKPLPYLNPSPAAATGARDTIETCGNLRIHRNSGETLMDKAIEILNSLQQKKEWLILKHRQNAFQSGELLRGWDFTEIAKLVEFPNYRQYTIPSKSARNWYRIAAERPQMTVLFGRHFGQLIESDSPELCTSCSKFEAPKYSLTATMSCLSILQDRGLPIQWMSTSNTNPIAPCREHRHGPSTRLQNLDAQKSHNTGNFEIPFSGGEDGAVIFGKPDLPYPKAEPCDPDFLNGTALISRKLKRKARVTSDEQVDQFLETLRPEVFPKYGTYLGNDAVPEGRPEHIQRASSIGSLPSVRLGPGM